MLWARSKAVEVYLGQTTVGCRGPDGLGDRWVDAASPEDGLSKLTELLSASAGALRVRIWLGAALARPFVVAANSGARNVGEAHELAATVANDGTGLSGELKVWLAPWRVGQATLAVAIPQPLHTLLLGMGRSRRGLRVFSARPWWNQVLDDVLQRSRAQSRSIGWTVAEPDGLVQGRIVSGDVLECTYEAPRALDPDASRMRRRLEIGWGDVDAVEHADFTASSDANDERFAIGGATTVQSDRAGP